MVNYGESSPIPKPFVTQKTGRKNGRLDQHKLWYGEGDPTELSSGPLIIPEMMVYKPLGKKNV